MLTDSPDAERYAPLVVRRLRRERQRRRRTRYEGPRRRWAPAAVSDAPSSDEGTETPTGDGPGRTHTTKALALVAVAVLIAVLVLHRTGSPSAGHVTTAVGPVPTTTTTTTAPPSPSASVTAPAASTTTLPLASPADITVAVDNGLLTGNLATNLTARLKADGYQTRPPDNTTVLTRTTAIYVARSGYSGEAARLAAQLGLTTGHVQIVSSLPTSAPIPPVSSSGADLVVVIGTSLQSVASTPPSTIAPPTTVAPKTTVPPTTVPPDDRGPDHRPGHDGPADDGRPDHRAPDHPADDLTDEHLTGGPDRRGDLGPWRRDPAHAGIFTDFDGTLSAIVDDPETAVPITGAVEMLGRLCARYRRVGVISGRSVEYLQRRLQLPGDDVGSRLTLDGLYGLERREGGVTVVRPEAQRWAAVVDAAGRAAERDAPGGVGVEHKGLAITLHARRAPERLPWIEQWAADQASSSGLEVLPGRMLFELRPPVKIDKGTVVEEMAAGLGAVCFAGDDVGDLPAFAALARLRANGVTTLAVAARSPESAPDLLEGADLVVDGPEGVLELFGRLAA